MSASSQEAVSTGTAPQGAASDIAITPRLFFVVSPYFSVFTDTFSAHFHARRYQKRVSVADCAYLGYHGGLVMTTTHDPLHKDWRRWEGSDGLN
jgi:hypothetical protein